MNAQHELMPAEEIRREPVVIQANATSLMEVIGRAASDPSTDVTKLERLMDLYERITSRTAEAAYSAALSEMQPELPIIGERGGIKDKYGKVQSTYAKWDDINEAIKPVLARHGFSISFLCGREEGQIIVTGVLRHRDGHKEQTTIHLPLDTSGSKNAVQAVGSSTSYGQRYTARALLNLTSRLAEDRDDDGQGSAPARFITDEQADEIRALVTKAEANIGKFLAVLKAESISDILTKDHARALGILQDRIDAKSRQGAKP
ncbi:ERF family protein [Methylobacterium bullatum]|uniref:ERF superfamily protein n=1 Tax=Methylobacterium bullatum TaxID=570505 RepID=A0AAV4ZCP3_9HYPH|nr:ERF family protein [Methylobacterium bullatum]MBD8902738.1 hypothetical protein [Methylobacterium bullatum]GJD41357.1 hypothetical protein OICFNHDK_3840 [Methylobacterium bullatum]